MGRERFFLTLVRSSVANRSECECECTCYCTKQKQCSERNLISLKLKNRRSNLGRYFSLYSVSKFRDWHKQRECNSSLKLEVSSAFKIHIKALSSSAGNAVAQLVDALRYKPKVAGSNPNEVIGFCDLPNTSSRILAPGVDSVSSRNKS